MEHDKALELAENLRSLANFIETDPSKLPPEGLEIKASSHIYGGDANKDTFLNLVQLALGSAEVVTIRKAYTDSYFEVHLSFGGIDYESWARRESVCDRRVVGTETVTEKVAVQYEEREVEKEIVEWDCHPLLKSSN